jgi:dipeptidyl aminopeptidase/acylaminoacyl peptidase
MTLHMTLATDRAQFHLPRLLAAGIDYNDFLIVLNELRDWSEWPVAWERLAAGHETLGDDALREGRHISAGEAFARAATYYHTAQTVVFDNIIEKARLQSRQHAASRKGMPYLRPSVEAFEVPFEDFFFPANLRIPPSGGKVPCVVLNAGADSTKEEFYTLENEFLKRGIATCGYDGPGQSLTWHKQKLRPDFEKPVGAILDVLSSHPKIDSSRFGIWGRSLGGYAACRVAAKEERIKACVSAGGFFDLLTCWDRGPAALHEALQFAFGLDSLEEARERSKQFTLAGILGGIRCPTLIVHSGQDKVMPMSEAERVRDDIGPAAQLVVYPEGSHVCDNIPYKIRPLVTDWMAGQLGAVAS